MSKYTKELKIKLVLEYLSWESGGQDKIANKYKIPQSTLKNWILKYQSGGFDNLTKKQSNDKFTSEFKLSVIQYRQITNASLRETAEYFNITNGSLICNWERAYRERGLSGLEDNSRIQITFRLKNYSVFVGSLHFASPFFYKILQF